MSDGASLGLESSQSLCVRFEDRMVHRNHKLLAEVHSAQDFLKAGIAFQLGKTWLDF